MTRGRFVTGVVVVVGLASFVGASLVASRSPRDLTTNSKEAYAYYMQGMEASNKHCWTDALRAWKKATEADTSFAMAWARLASYSAGLGDRQEARSCYLRAERGLDRVTKREGLLIRIIGAGILDRPAEKKSLETRLIAEYPDDPEALLRAASRSADRGDYAAAEADYRRLLELEPGQGEAYNRMGYVFASQGRWAEATEAFQKYAFIYPDEPNPHDSLGELYLRTGQYADALKEFEKALDIKPDFIWARDHRAMVFADQGRYREALEETHHIETALSGTLDDYAWRLYDVRLVMDSGDLDRALDMARKLSAAHLKHAGLHQVLGRIYTRAGDLRSAEAERKILLALLEEGRREKGRDPAGASETFSVLELEGDMAGAAGHWPGAADFYARAVKRSGGSWSRERRARRKLVEALVRAERFQEAVTAGEKVLAENPHDPVANFWLAKALDAGGERAQAESHYREVLQVLGRADLGNALRAEASERAGALAESAQR